MDNISNIKFSNSQQIQSVTREENNPSANLKTKNDSYSFKAKSNKSNNNESGKNVFPAVASFFIPGFGQFLNGENGKGIKHLVGGLLICCAGVVFPPLRLGWCALSIYSSVEAYKYKKSEKPE